MQIEKLGVSTIRYLLSKEELGCLLKFTASEKDDIAMHAVAFCDSGCGASDSETVLLIDATGRKHRPEVGNLVYAAPAGMLKKAHASAVGKSAGVQVTFANDGSLHGTLQIEVGTLSEFVPPTLLNPITILSGPCPPQHGHYPDLNRVYAMLGGIPSETELVRPFDYGINARFFDRVLMVSKCANPKSVSQPASALPLQGPFDASFYWFENVDAKTSYLVVIMPVELQ